MGVLDTAAASASGLPAVQPAGGAQTFSTMGPGLVEGMGEAATVAALNSWGAARDRELVQLRPRCDPDRCRLSLRAGQGGTAGHSRRLPHRGGDDAAACAARGDAVGARLELVVAEARARFDAQDGRFTEGLSEPVRRQQAVETWARAEPIRVAAIVQAAPAPPWVPTSPGGTPLTFYPSPGTQAAPTTPPPRAATAPAWDASPQAPGATPAWDAWAAGRGAQAAAPPDAWAAGLAAQAAPWPPAAPRQFDMGTPGGSGGGGGKGGYPYPKEMRIDARSWGDHRKLWPRPSRASRSGRTAP